MWQWTLWHLIGHPKNVYATISFHSLFNRRPTERSVYFSRELKDASHATRLVFRIALHRVNFGLSRALAPHVQ